MNKTLKNNFFINSWKNEKPFFKVATKIAIICFIINIINCLTFKLYFIEIFTLSNIILYALAECIRVTYGFIKYSVQLIIKLLSIFNNKERK